MLITKVFRKERVTHMQNCSPKSWTWSHHPNQSLQPRTSSTGLLPLSPLASQKVLTPCPRRRLPFPHHWQGPEVSQGKPWVLAMPSPSYCKMNPVLVGTGTTTYTTFGNLSRGKRGLEIPLPSGLWWAYSHWWLREFPFWFEAASDTEFDILKWIQWVYFLRKTDNFTFGWGIWWKPL